MTFEDRVRDCAEKGMTKYATADALKVPKGKFLELAKLLPDIPWRGRGKYPGQIEHLQKIRDAQKAGVLAGLTKGGAVLRKKRGVKAFGHTASIHGHCLRIGVRSSTVWYCMNKQGMSLEQALIEVKGRQKIH